MMFVCLEDGQDGHYLMTYSRHHCGLTAVSTPVLRLGTDIPPSSWKS